MSIISPTFTKRDKGIVINIFDHCVVTSKFFNLHKTRLSIITPTFTKRDQGIVINLSDHYSNPSRLYVFHTTTYYHLKHKKYKYSFIIYHMYTKRSFPFFHKQASTLVNIFSIAFFQILFHLSSLTHSFYLESKPFYLSFFPYLFLNWAIPGLFFGFSLFNS